MQEVGGSIPPGSTSLRELRLGCAGVISGGDELQFIIRY